MNRNCIHTVLLNVLISCAVALISPPAQALPFPHTDQSVNITYYSDSTRAIEIGWRRYGYCGENYDIGSHSQYFGIEIGTCVSTPSVEMMSLDDTEAKNRQIDISQTAGIDLKRIPTDFPLCWNIQGKSCGIRGSTQNCTDGTFIDYVCICMPDRHWQCPEVR